MTYDPAIARDVFNGLLWTGIAEAIGCGFGLLLLAFLPTWDENL